MVRQKARKSVEELYAPKFETTPIKSQVQHISNTVKSTRNDRDLSGYIICSNTPYNTAACTGSNSNSIPAANLATNRRKSSRPPTTKVNDKSFNKEEKMLNLDEVKADHSVKAKTTRPDKCRYNSPNMYDNKNYMNTPPENSQKDVRQNAHNHHHQHHATHDDDKDDDTEEFFELIRQTVESAIGKSVSDLLNRNFRELSVKVDRFSAELKTTNSLLSKLQGDINNKVVHYGEENSRHFRYLCMKSEYDKMFYQHQSMMNAPPSQQQPEKRSSAPKANIHIESDKMQNACSCRSSKPPIGLEQQQKFSSTEEHSVSNKSSEVGMREVLEHIQRFCNQMQLNDLKSDDRMARSAFHLDDNVKLNKQAFEEDDDDSPMSSDGMTPRSDHIHKYGGNTMRSCSAARSGGGDA